MDPHLPVKRDKKHSNTMWYVILSENNDYWILSLVDMWTKKKALPHWRLHGVSFPKTTCYWYLKFFFWPPLKLHLYLQGSVSWESFYDFRLLILYFHYGLKGKQQQTIFKTLVHFSGRKPNDQNSNWSNTILLNADAKIPLIIELYQIKK